MPRAYWRFSGTWVILWHSKIRTLITPFADDMQGQKHGRPADVPAFISALEDCATDVSAWCAAKRLQLNAEKTEVLWFGMPANLRKIPSDTRSIRLGFAVVDPVNVVRERHFRRRIVDARARPRRQYSTRTSRAPVNVYVSDTVTAVDSRAMRSSTNCDYSSVELLSGSATGRSQLLPPEPEIGCHQN